MNCETQQQLIGIIEERNCSVASALCTIYPELELIDPTAKFYLDQPILDAIRAQEKIGKFMSREVAKNLGITPKNASKLIRGLTGEDLDNFALAKIIEEGTPAMKRQRVFDIKDILDSNVRFKLGTGIYQHFPSILDKSLPHPRLPAKERIAKFMELNGYSYIDLAWMNFGYDDLNPHSGVSAYFKKLIRDKLNLSLRVVGLISDSDLDSDPHFHISPSGTLYVEISKKSSPREISLQVEHLIEIIELGVSEHLDKQGLNQESIAAVPTQKYSSKRKRNLVNCFNDSLSLMSPSELATSLELLNRHIKSNKQLSRHKRQELYLIKSVYLEQALSSGLAQILFYVHRPNRYLLDDADIADWDDVIKLIEKQYTDGNPSEQCRKLFSSLEKHGQIELNGDYSINRLTDYGQYKYRLTRYLMMKFDGDLIGALFQLFDRKPSVYGCFVPMNAEKKRFFVTSSRHKIHRHFDSSYMDVWEVEFCGHIFHVPHTIFANKIQDDYEVRCEDESITYGTPLTDIEKATISFEQALENVCAASWANENT